jgi:hypothetical protein
MLLCTCVQEKGGGGEGQHLVFVIFPFLNHNILNQDENYIMPGLENIIKTTE